jgi:hypothetical protein
MHRPIINLKGPKLTLSPPTNRIPLPNFLKPPKPRPKNHQTLPAIPILQILFPSSMRPLNNLTTTRL